MSSDSSQPDTLDVFPVALFVFNRPDHTRQVIEALSAQQPARIYVFADGPRHRFDHPMVDAVRQLVRNLDIPGCELDLVERSSNFGLARSIITGVSLVLEKHPGVIVLEDDCVPLPGFLSYMNRALHVYQQDQRVACVSGYGPAIEAPPGDTASGYFTRRISTWGWGTWPRAWELLATNWADEAQILRRQEPDWHELGWDFQRYLQDANTGQQIGKNVWSPLWQFPVYRADMLTFWPYATRVDNIGRDGSGINCSQAGMDAPPPRGENTNTLTLPPVSSPDRSTACDFALLIGGTANRPTIKQRIRRVLAQNPLLREAYYWLRVARGQPPRSDPERLQRLQTLMCTPHGAKSRTTQLTDLGWGQIRYTDATILYHQFREIFLECCYAVDLTTDRPYIVDCGGNIGLGTVFFKQQFPASRIDVFEADPRVHEILLDNIQRLGLQDVTIHGAAVAAREGYAHFLSTGNDDGRLLDTQSDDDGRFVQVPMVRLSQRLREDVDLLKMDIEGAEFELLKDLHDTGWLKRIKNLICEVHFTPDTQPAFGELIELLSRAGYALTLRGLREQPELGGYSWRTPFPAARAGQFVALVYAWRH